MDSSKRPWREAASALASAWSSAAITIAISSIRAGRNVMSRWRTRASATWKTSRPITATCSTKRSGPGTSKPTRRTAAPATASTARRAVLARIARTLPAPDPQLFLQNAQDVPYVEGVPADKLIAQREQLNKCRIDSIHRFLATQGLTHPGMNYQVAVHDFVPNGIPSHWTPLAIEGIEKNIKTGTPQAISPPTYATK